MSSLNSILDELRLNLKIDGQKNHLQTSNLIDEIFHRYDIKSKGSDRKRRLRSNGDPYTTRPEAFFSSLPIDTHCHLSVSRRLPNCSLSQNSLLASDPESLWRNFFDGDAKTSEKTFLSVNSALKKIGVPYKISRRKILQTVYKPVIDGSNDSEPDYSSFDSEIVFIDRRGVTHTAQSLGSGVGVLIPVLLALATTNSWLISIEEPETHVHPSWQTKIGDLILENSNRICFDREYLESEDFDEEGHEYQQGWDGYWWKTKLFIETHSEHLILRILRRIRESTEKDFSVWTDELKAAYPEGVRPDDVAVLFVQPGENGAEVIELPVDANGEFTCEWPGGFFEERLNEYF